MKKIVVIYLAVFLGLIFPMSAAYAWCWPWCGCGVDYGKKVPALQEEKVQRETLDLKDELFKSDLYLSKPNPGRIAPLRQKMIDLEKRNRGQTDR